MGFHICEYGCRPEERVYSNISSGDVILVFASGNAWTMPDMILHYIADHQWRPSAEFINDVMNGKLVCSTRAQTKSITRDIGYLSGPFETGPVPEGFVEKLEKMMIGAEVNGNPVRYREIEIRTN